MDEEKFDQLLVEELYGELDAETSAAVRRYAASHPRAGDKLRALERARLAASTLDADLPNDLEAKILVRAHRAHATLPARARIAGWLARAGDWAMRPQTAMAAVFLVMIGSSVLLVQGKLGRAPRSAAVRVNEEGTPLASGASDEPRDPLDPKTVALAHGAEERKRVAPPPPPPVPSAEEEDTEGTVARAEAVAGDDGTQAPAAATMDAPEPVQNAAVPGGVGVGGGLGVGGVAGAGGGGGGSHTLAGAAPASGGAPDPAPRRESAKVEEAQAPAAARAQVQAPAKGAAPRASDTSAPSADLQDSWGIVEKKSAPAPSPRPQEQAAPQAPADSASGEQREGSRDVARGGEGAPGQRAPVSEMDQAIAAYRSGEYGTAAKLFAARAAQGDALADLWLARTARQTQGCGAAAKKFDAVTSRHAGTHVAHDATLEAAHCYRAIGEENAAQQRFASLVNVQSHADRARNALHPGGSKAAPRSTGTPAPATPPSKR